MRPSTVFTLLFVVTIPTLCWFLGNRLGGFRSEDLENSYQEHQLKLQLRDLKQKQSELDAARQRAIELESGMIAIMVKQYESATDEMQKEWYSHQILEARERLKILTPSAMTGEGGK